MLAGDASLTSSSVTNHGLLEGTGGTGTGVVTSKVINTGTIEASSGTLEVKGAVTGKGTDTISGAATLEFGAGVSSAKTLGDQDIGFHGGGTLHLLKPTSFYGEISDFGAGDTVELLGSWAFSRISHAGDVTTLTLAKQLDHARLRVRRRLLAERLQHRPGNDHENRIRVTPAFAGWVRANGGPSRARPRRRRSPRDKPLVEVLWRGGDARRVAFAVRRSVRPAPSPCPQQQLEARRGSNPRGLSEDRRTCGMAVARDATAPGGIPTLWRREQRQTVGAGGSRLHDAAEVERLRPALAPVRQREVVE